MAKSIIKGDNKNKCYLCGSGRWLERHHLFGGALRDKSEKYGLTVYLCHYCHNEPPVGAHYSTETMNMLRQIGQAAAMETYGWSKDKFIEEFKKNYLED